MTPRPEFAMLWDSRAEAFTPQGSFAMAYIAPPPDLLHLVTTFYIFRSSDAVIKDFQPAGIGHMMFFLKGEGQARFHDGHIDDSHEASLICPSNAAMQYIVRGPFHCFGCAFTPLGWRALTGVPVDEMMDRLINAHDVVRQDCGDLITTLRAIDHQFGPAPIDAELQDLGEQLAHETATILSQCFQPVPHSAIDRVAKIAAWVEGAMSPRVEDLVERLGVSERHVQRLVTEYFGCSPKFLARKYRAIRVAMALADPNLGEDERAALHDVFYDQSHMIREIRHFVGKTPAGLAHDDNGLLQMWLDPENIRELRQ